MSETPLLGLPILEAAQAQKHVTHNEALLLLDAAIHLSVISRAVATPPGAGNDGDRYLVGPGPAGLWTGQDGKLAIRQGGAWIFALPRKGWRVWVEDEEKFLVYDGAVWRDLSISGGDKGDVQIGAGGDWLVERSGGAVGNGIADDTAALQSVLASGKSIVLNPAKTYLITTRLQITVAGTGIEGNGASLVMSTAAGHFDNAVFANRYGANAVGIYANGIAGAFVRALNIRPSAWVDVRYLKPIFFNTVADADFSGLDISGFSRGGGLITLDDCKHPSIDNCHFHDCYTNSLTVDGTQPISSCQITGIEVDNGAAVGSIGGRVTRCRFINLTTGEALRAARGYQTDGVNLQGVGTTKPSRGWSITSCYFENLGEGIDCFGDDNVFSNNVFRLCFGAGVKLIAGPSRNIVTRNIFTQMGLCAVLLSGSAAVSVNADANQITHNVIRGVAADVDWINADGGFSYQRSANGGVAAWSASAVSAGIFFDSNASDTSNVTNTFVDGNHIDLGGTGKYGIASKTSAVGSQKIGRSNTVRNALTASILNNGAYMKFEDGAPAIKTANFTLAHDEVVLVNNKAGSSCTVTLPAATLYPGRKLSFVNWQAQTVLSASSNIVPMAGGAAGTAILPAVAGSWADLLSDGAAWNIVGGSMAPHTQAASSITDFAESVDDRVAALLTAGSNVALNYNDAANTLTISATGAVMTPLTIDLGGGLGLRDFEATITDAAVTPASIIEIGMAATSDADENEPEFTGLAAAVARASSGSFALSLSFTEPHSGLLKLQYRIN